MINKRLESFLQTVKQPAQYVGGELGSVIKDIEGKLRFAFCFPDTYEIGMSHLGMKILYGLLNTKEDIWCERVFAPEKDMEEKMRENDILLYALESFDPLNMFDIIGFSLQYELSYTNVLNMLNLGGIPVLKKERKGLKNLVIAGGPNTCNPEPMSDFIDVFFLGESEINLIEFTTLYNKAKKEKWSKEEFLRQSSLIQGVYVPELYSVKYKKDGTIDKVLGEKNAPLPIKKALIENLDEVYFPTDFVVPFVRPVHDRAIIEIMRGCIRGCRFCQAGFIYRPQREKSYKNLSITARELCQSTGYDEVSLSSLSTSDYLEIEPLLDSMLEWTKDEQVSLSLPSLRVDNFSDELVEKIQSVRKSSLTFAPEAGSQRLRDVINKNVTEEEVMRTCKRAFENGYTTVKLYFMMGLPTETMEDIKAINDLSKKIVDLYYATENRNKNRPIAINVSVAVFVPKPITPFEFEPQDTRELIIEKQKYLKETISSKRVSLSYHDTNTSILEAVLARGDRRLGKVILEAYNRGCTMDSWGEHFKFGIWQDVFNDTKTEIEFYANRKRQYDEVMPWDHLDYFVDKKFLIDENITAKNENTSLNCREKCLSCGVNKNVKEGVCFEKN